MNFQELQQKIKEIGFENFGDQNFDQSLLPNFKLVEQVGDCEGGGELSYKVFHFTEENIYVKIKGYYSSYEGTNWDDSISEVFPKEKTIIVYE